MRNINRFLAVGLAAAMTLSLAACSKSEGNGADDGPTDTMTKVPEDTPEEETLGGEASDAGAASGKTQGDKEIAYDECELTFSWWGDGARHEAMLAAIEAFEAKYPGITVKETYGAWSGWEESMADMFDTKTAPDVNQVDWSWIASYSSDGNAFLDLNTVSDSLDLSQFDQKYLDMCTAAGKLQAVPAAMTGRIFYWNKTAFDEAGIDTPKTLADLTAAGETFRTELGEDYYPLVLGEYDKMVLMVYYLESVYGRNWVENDTLNFTQEEIQEGLELIRSLEDKHAIPPAMDVAGDADYLEENTNWVKGKYAGVFRWDYEAGKFAGALDEGLEFAVGEELSDMGDYHGGFSKVALGFAISEDTAHPAEAALLLQFLLNEEEGTAILASENGIPLSEAALENCSAQGLLDKAVWEANGKVLEYVSYDFDPKFEDARLRDENGVYCDVMLGLSSGDYDSAAAAQVLFDGITDVLSE